MYIHSLYIVSLFEKFEPTLLVLFQCPRGVVAVWSCYGRSAVEVRSRCSRVTVVLRLRCGRGTLVVRSRCASVTLTGAVPVRCGTLTFYQAVL